jgi:hypothetical protein
LLFCDEGLRKDFNLPKLSIRLKKKFLNCGKAVHLTFLLCLFAFSSAEKVKITLFFSSEALYAVTLTSIPCLVLRKSKYCFSNGASDMICGQFHQHFISSFCANFLATKNHHKLKHIKAIRCTFVPKS